MKRFLKKVYELVPFKKFLFTVLRFFWRPDEHIYKHLHFKGIIKVRLSKQNSFKMMHYGYLIENSLFWKGVENCWEKESVKIWMKLVKDSDVILDIGSNTGVYALIAKCINPDSKVYAFEPVKRVYDKLEKNVILNNYSIKTFESAVSDSDGRAIIYEPLDEHVYSVTVNQNLRNSGTAVNKVDIETITLKTFILNEKLEKIDLIKMDVETHEFEALSGMAEYLEKFKPTILIEILNDEVALKIENLVKNVNYLFFNINEHDSVRRVNSLTKSDYYNFLLCSREIAVKLKLEN